MPARPRSGSLWTTLAGVLLLVCPGASGEQPLPPQLAGVGVTERLGQPVDLGLVFTDEDGRAVRLGDFFRRGRPVILDLVYYSCPMLCTLVLNGQTSALARMPLAAGRDYEIVTVSIDPTETPELARAKKSVYVEKARQDGGGWRFLTDLGGNVKKLAEQVGFHYTYDKSTSQYAHQAAIMILTPEGEVSRYLYGIEFRPRDIRLALAEASRGRFTFSLDHLLLYCFHYDPLARSYVLFASNLMRAGGLGIVAGLAWLLWRLRRRERMLSRRHSEARA